ncbi:bZIP transcription factor family protein [Forsythia ovata]|uniref:BZIP transcription factor family protein n=1 Tax=Forsythia ovata TaxID=205694 RepID=A0ABD1X5Y8_9LAMI
MASHRIEESALSDFGHIPYAVPHMIHPPTTFTNQEGSAFDFGELEEAIVLQAVNETKQPLYAGRPAATLEMFPSWPMRFHHTIRGSSKSGEESTDSGSAVHTLSSRGEGSRLEPESPVGRKTDSSSDHRVIDQMHHLQLPQQMDMASGSDSPRTGMSQAQPVAKPTSEKRRGAGSNSERLLDAKTLRRLAQNREAAKKSRIRKKVYVQQLESSRIRLSQLEQDLQRARSQGFFVGGGGGAGGNISSGAAIFDMEYARWLDDDHRHMSEIRTALQAHLSDGDLRVILDGYIAHYDEIFRLKGDAAKSDVFHLITGMWTTPAERCFLWMGGFRPSELIKMLTAQLDPLTEQQLMGIYSLQRSTEQAEEALSQGLEQLQQSLTDTLASGSVNDSMHHMAVALGKLTNLEGFVRQADNLRQQTLHQLHRVLTVRQTARCFLVIGEYYGRLRALSSLWASRPRETLIGDDISCQTTTDLQMVQSSQNHFSNF